MCTHVHEVSADNCYPEARPLLQTQSQRGIFSKLHVTTICTFFNQQAVLSEIINNGLYIVKSKELKWSLKDAESFYKEHKGYYYVRDGAIDTVLSWHMSHPVAKCQNRIT